MLIRLKSAINTNDFSDPNVKKFLLFRQELSVSDSGLILNGEQIMLPESLVSEVLEIAHEGHLGIKRTQRLIKDKLCLSDWINGLRGR